MSYRNDDEQIIFLSPQELGLCFLREDGGVQALDGSVGGALVQDQDAVGREVVVAAEGAFGEEIMHRLVEGDAHRGALVIEEEINFGVFFLPQADFDGVRHFEKTVQKTGCLLYTS